MTDADLADVARGEVASREKHYPALVASAKMTPDEATVDFQAWHAIAGWLENDRFESIGAGGIDGLTIVDWALAEAAADRAVAVTTDQLTRADQGGDGRKAAALGGRLAALRAIARRVGAMRASIDSMNRTARERRQSAAEAKAA